MCSVCKNEVVIPAGVVTLVDGVVADIMRELPHIISEAVLSVLQESGFDDIEFDDIETGLKIVSERCLEERCLQDGLKDG